MTISKRYITKPGRNLALITLRFRKRSCRQSALLYSLSNVFMSPAPKAEYALTLNWTESEASSPQGRLLKMLITSMLCTRGHPKQLNDICMKSLEDYCVWMEVTYAKCMQPYATALRGESMLGRPDEFSHHTECPESLPHVMSYM